jgi:signal transduction histidine kinase
VQVGKLLKLLAAGAQLPDAEWPRLQPNVAAVQPNAIDKCHEGAHFHVMATIPLDPPGVPIGDAGAGSDMKMLRSRRVRAELWLTLIFWGSNLALLTLGTALSGNPHLAELTGMRVLTTMVGLGFCFLIHLLLKHPRLTTTRSRLIALALAAPVLAEAYAWSSYFAEAAVMPELRDVELSWSTVVRTISFWTWFFLAWSGLYLALSYSFDVAEEQQRSAEIRERAHDAQLRALHSQINPHFLFNSLNSVSALILDRDGDRAEEMVTKLARFLRMGLAADPTETITLAKEVELQRAYLEIEQLRYQDLGIDFDIPVALSGARIPALILQPIVENAVKYGVAGAEPPATISLRAREDAGRLLLEVRDSGNGSGKVLPGAGIGLSNVLQRIRLIYGEDRAALAAARLPDGTFRVRLELPLERA